MKVKMQTLSGSVYVIDMTNLTWERVNTRPIFGLEERNSGRLTAKPTLFIGGRAVLNDALAGPIYTTKIVRLEDISTEEEEEVPA